ncbi:hypothetical protein [Dictyoglomus thermophilum]|jgi:hypothetical protein|uniref:Uncharacterized protein n=1 Tax=Dictyoglomus thermophilum (strain ATCC 35947 / DSM 3960 / H-6-12) TaxID=309799 RepID=B5YBZ4_DICT6|nr:hypothetical protein [Dictyoglomus thermophilum]ACI19866.1 hypothetical protein DICTH_0219 [Dictyoglomus thermophilum H-6-12]TYT20335.1 secretion system protein E [Dictyoglomus thermophilum]
MEYIVKKEEVSLASKWCPFVCGLGCGAICAAGCYVDTPGIPLMDVVAGTRGSYAAYGKAKVL